MESVSELATEKEFYEYLADPDKKFSMLNKYGIIRKGFMKFNTPLSSSAPVERLFSYATLVNTPNRNSLSDSNFEKLVIMKPNLSD